MSLPLSVQRSFTKTRSI
uniref:Uncharacterized protein n=1 Tax=Anguilla anguilla TaxID=7936 RepID=A0A0E9RGY9_ANGAN